MVEVLGFNPVLDRARGATERNLGKEKGVVRRGEAGNRLEGADDAGPRRAPAGIHENVYVPESLVRHTDLAARG